MSNEYTPSSAMHDVLSCALRTAGAFRETCPRPGEGGVGWVVPVRLLLETTCEELAIILSEIAPGGSVLTRHVWEALQFDKFGGIGDISNEERHAVLAKMEAQS